MSKTVEVQSPQQFTQLLSSSNIVVADFWAPWCGPCKAIAPVYEQLSAQLSRPGKITFTRVNTDNQQQIAQTYNISAMPTFLILKQGRETTRIRGADGAKLQEAVRKLANEAESIDAGGSSSDAGAGASGSQWRGVALPRGYGDITDQVDVRGLDLLNADGEYGGARTLFESGSPSALGKGKSDGKKDWVESDTDEQLLLFVPFQATLKIHTLHLTSLPGTGEDAPMRPKTVRLYVNHAHNLGFEEAEDTTATQEIVLKPSDWDSKSGTAKCELRFVKFQKCSSLVVFVKDGDGDGDKVRLDRVRVIGEAGSARDMGKLQKVGEDE